MLLAVVLSLGYAIAYNSGEPDLLPIHVEPSAAIVDQLSITNPNATFVHQATQALNASGYIVDYYPGEEVTVDFYKRLPSMGYDVLILRTHSSAEHADPLDEDVVIFTGEEYRHARHVEDQYMGRLSRVGYNPEQYKEDGKSWFAIRPSLIKDARGGFEGTMVFMMGCQGLANPTIGDVFLQKGATAYVGWDGQVSAIHTDTSMLMLIQHHLEGMPVRDATQITMTLLGEDPAYGSNLGALEKEANSKEVKQ